MITKRILVIAGAGLLVAAVVAVAVAVPVSITHRQAAPAPPPSSTSDSLTNSQTAEAQPQTDTIGSSGVSDSRSSSNNSSAVPELAALLPSGTPACNGVPGLCSVPVRLVTFPGTHNSMAIRNNITLASSQALSFHQQLQAGARLFDIDYAGDRFGGRFGHCFSCFCSFAADANEADPSKVFTVMADFLAANPRDVIVLGLSNINCGDVPTARTQLLGLLAQSPLYKYLATQVVTGSTSLGDLVDAGQRAVMLFYDQWTTSTGYTVGSKAVPNQQLLRLYGENAEVTVDGDAAIDTQVAKSLFVDINTQFQQRSADASIPWRVLGLFPSTCTSCRSSTSQCGALACAVQANSQAYVLWVLGKVTAAWMKAIGRTAVVPAFNGFQVDYIQLPTGRPGVVTAAEQLNAAFAWMYTQQIGAAPALGLGNCVWVLDDAVYAGGLVCAGQKTVGISSLLRVGAATPMFGATGAHRRRLLQAAAVSGRQLLVPANKQLKVQLLIGLLVQTTVLGDMQQLQVLPIDAAVDALQVVWQ